MDPSSFTFKVSVPNDPALASIVGEVARHAAAYAQLEAGAAAVFAERAQAAAVTAFTAGTGAATTAAIAAANGTLTITVGGETVSQPLP